MENGASMTSNVSAAKGPQDPLHVTTVMMVRHGETAWNRIKRIQGQIDIPLSDTGLRQAALLARRIGRERGVDAVISSDLSRAMQTAAPLAEALGLDVIPDARVRERHYGVFQANDTESILAQWPQAHASWVSNDPDFTPETGESQRVFHARVVNALKSIVRQHAGKTIICVAHGGVLDHAYRFASAMPLDVPRSHQLLNASVNVIEWHHGADPEQDHAGVRAWADVSHLAEDDAVSRDDT